MKKLTLLLIFSNVLFLLSAQSNNITIQPGFFINAYKDTVASPLTQTSYTLGFNLKYAYKGKLNFHIVNASFTIGDPKSAANGSALQGQYYNPETGELEIQISTWQPLYIYASLYYSYYRKVYSNGNYSLSPGFNISFDMNMHFAQYPAINAMASIGPAIQQEIFLKNKDSISIELAMPLIEYIYRPPFAGCDDILMNTVAENTIGVFALGEITAIHEVFKIKLRANYTFEILPWMDGIIETCFHYSRIAEPRPRYELYSQLFTGVNFKF